MIFVDPPPPEITVNILLFILIIAACLEEYNITVIVKW